MSNVSIRETTDIMEKVFRFIKTIPTFKNCHLEYLESERESLCMKRVGSSHIIKSNIIGGYTAELPFMIYYRTNVKDTKSLINITKPFDELAMACEKETYDHFPSIVLPEGFIPLRLEMIETPEDLTGKEDNMATFMAIYKITYRKK
jgi:hypothetical protein